MTMACKYSVLFTFIFVQGTWSAPATDSSNTVSTGTQMADQFNKNLAAVMNNMHKGATNLASPPIKFGVDTVPSLLHHGVQTISDKANKISQASKESFGKVAAGLGHTIGGGGVLGSSIAGGVMEVGGHALGAGGNVIEAGANAGIGFTGALGDNAASGITVSGQLANDALNTLGNTMIAAGSGVGVMSDGVALLVDAIGSGLAMGINKAEKTVEGLMNSGVLKLENGVLKFSSSTQANIYSVLNSFLQILVNVQKLFENLRTTISVTGTPSLGATGTVTGSVGSTGSSTSTTGNLGAAGGTGNSGAAVSGTVKAGTGGSTGAGSKKA